MKRWHFLLWPVIAIVSWLVSRYNFLFFHSLVELTAIVAAGILVTIAIVARGKNNLVTRIGTLYGVVMIIDVLHTLSYKGMGVFPGWSSNQATQFWILGRAIEASGLALALLLPGRRDYNKKYLTVFLIAGFAGITAVSTGFFPDCFIEGVGLTSFKVSMEYLIIAVIALTIWLLYKSESEEIRPYRNYFMVALLLTAAGELAFTLYTDVYGFSNMLGHIFRLISYVVILQGVIYRSLKEPLDTIYSKMGRTLEEVMNIVSETTEIKDPYTGGHQKRVAQLACKIAEKMKLSPSNRESLRMAARLHDVGKLFVPTDIISKVTALNEIEYGFIKEHPGKSYELLKGIPFDGPVLDTILQHHERLDGSGYPCNLAGDDIIITARILAVADVVEAMLSNRPHRRAHSLNETLSEIKTNSGKLYDSQVVEACLSLFDGGFAFESDKE